MKIIEVLKAAIHSKEKLKKNMCLLGEVFRRSDFIILGNNIQLIPLHLLTILRKAIIFFGTDQLLLILILEIQKTLTYF